VYEKVIGQIAKESREGNLAKPLRILEIGVHKGGSIELWHSYFGPDAMIYGIDISPDIDLINFSFTNVKLFVGDQSDIRFLQKVVAEAGYFDIIIDDGSHNSQDVIVTLNYLFSSLSQNGKYIIEDTHVSYWPKEDGGYKRPGSTIEVLKSLIDELHKHYFRKTLQNTTGIKHDELLSIEFFDSIAVLHKRENYEPLRFFYEPIRDI
jgi:23S rRNA U2552 (ribose-2'-O)-methylase RlmE/FtsJ